MNLEFSEDQKFVQKTARDYLTEHAPLSACRAVLESEQALRPHPLEGRRGDGLARHGGPRELRRRRPRPPRARADRAGDRPLARADPVLVVGLPRDRGAAPGRQRGAEEEVPAEARLGRAGSARFALAEGLGDFDAASVAKTSFDGEPLSGAKVPVADGAAANFAVVVAKEGKRPSRLALVDLEGEGVTRSAARELRPEPRRSRGSSSKARAPSGSAPRGRARQIASRRARPRGGDDGLRADRRRRARARDHARLHAWAASPSAVRWRRSRR